MEEDEDLFSWTENMHQAYRGKRRQELGDKKLKALEELKFPWSFTHSQRNVWKQPRTESSSLPQQQQQLQRRWNEYFPMLQDFHAIHGHCNVTDKDNKNLHKWVTSLRKNYQCQTIVRDLAPVATLSTSWTATAAASPLLSAEQLNALQALNFSWSTKKRKVPKGMAKWKTWEEYFPRLVQFYKEHGHCNVTRSEHDKDLYEWRQSLPYRQYTKEKVQLLQQLGVNLTVQPRAPWKPLDRKEMIDRLRAFYQEHGHVVVTPNDKDPELCEWTQRYIRSHTYRNLCRLVMPNYGKTRTQEKWEAMLERLREFHQKHGHFSVRGDSKLYNFVKNQRHQYRLFVRGKRSQMTRERIEALEQIGFEWGKSHDIRWNERMQELDTFSTIYGHQAVPQEFERNPQLGRWVMNQRTFKRRNGLRTSRVKALERRNFTWNMRNKQWWDMFQALKDFQEEHDHLKLPTSDPAYASLRQWLSEQRHFYRSQKFRHCLTDDRIEALESIPGFEWRVSVSKAPTKADWSELLKAMRAKGISSQVKAKRHWFDGVNPFEQEVKTVWTEEDIMALWNEESGEEDDYYYEDENSMNFLRA
jgi:hypothetical protein